MPELPSPGPYIKVQLVWDIGPNNTGMNVLHYFYSGARPNATDCTSLATRAAAGFTTAVGALFHTATILKQVVVTDMQGNDGAQGSWTGSHPGTDIQAFVPAGSAILMSLHVAARYRGGHPRVYWPPGTSGSMASTTAWSTTFISSAQTALSAFLNNLQNFTAGGTVTGSQYAISYYKGKDANGKPAVRPTPLPLAVTSRTVQTQIASMRPRLRP